MIPTYSEETHASYACECGKVIRVHRNIEINIICPMCNTDMGHHDSEGI
jgi:hypothetical protein